VALVGLLGDTIKRHGDLVGDAACGHLHRAIFTMCHIGRRPQAFQRIAELPAARADVVGLIAHPDEIIERVFKVATGRPAP
jgi:hypothetical protein